MRPERITPQLPGGVRETLTSLMTASYELGISKRVLRRAHRQGRVAGALSRGRLYVQMDGRAKQLAQDSREWQVRSDTTRNPVKARPKKSRSERSLAKKILAMMVGIGGIGGRRS